MVEWWQVVLANVVTLTVALLTGYFLPQLRARRERQQRVKDVAARYHEALLNAANDLQSRLWNIVANEFLPVYLMSESASDQDREYAETNTVWLVAQYFCWIEVMRREGGFAVLALDKGSEPLLRAIEKTRSAFASDAYAPAMRVFWGRQRAIGELTITERAVGEERRADCIGYAEFLEGLRTKDATYGRWFGQLSRDVHVVAHQMARGETPERLIAVQNQLVEVINALDPRGVRVPRQARQPLASTSRAATPV